MDVLEESIVQQRPVKVSSCESTSIAAMLPIRWPQGSVSFGLDDKRYLRINKAGKTDLNGGRKGPYTEFSVIANEDGKLILQALKSGKWLSVIGSELVSSEHPEPLLLEFSTQAPIIVPSHILAFPFPVQVCQKDGYTLLGTGSGNVACSAEGKFHRKGNHGKWAQWYMEQKPDGISFKNVGHGKYLCLGSDGALELADAPVFFALADNAPAPCIAEMPVIDKGALSAADLTHFKERGYIIVRNAVPPELVRGALRSINFQLSKPDCWEADGNPLNAAQLALKLPPEGIGADIFNKSAVFWSAVNILLGVGNVTPWRSGQQVALRFPQPPDRGHDIPDIRPGTQYHIDGMGQNKLCPFTLLCGVALSDQTRPNMGNLHVFPGSHLHEDLHKYYRDRINEDNQGEADTSKPDLGESEQVLLMPGDVVIAHQLLAHRVGVNTSEHIRYQLYYRVKHKSHDELKGRIIDNPWVEFVI